MLDWHGGMVMLRIVLWVDLFLMALGTLQKENRFVPSN